MPFPDIDPVAFAIGPFAVRWYALAYLAGIGLGLAYGSTLLNRKSLWADNTPPFTTADWMDFAFWAVLAIVFGGRLGYVIFYNPAYFAANPGEILQIWQGGMSFHGGLVALVVSMIVFARIKGARVLSALDLMAAVAPIGLMLGRIANFINGELFGRETNLPWGVVFPMGGPEPRHPTQLYEAALEGLVLFLILRYLTHIADALRSPGLVGGAFCIGYALFRFMVEFVRLPDAHIGYLYGGWLTVGMLLTLPVLALGIGLAVAGSRARDA